MAHSIEAGKVVSLHYTLKNRAGDVIDSSSGQGPLTYLHGTGSLIPGLETKLDGHGAGEQMTVEVAPADGYGEKQGPGPQPVPRAAFPAEAPLEIGMQFAVEAPDGTPMPVWVTKVDVDHVFIDINHPLAGETLFFAVEIVEVREATAEERAHGHVHGPGGHH